MYFIGDGFDLYASASEGAGGNHWTTVNSGSFSLLLSTTTRFGYGQSIQFGNNGHPIYRKTGGPNSATWWVCLAFAQFQALGGSTQGFSFNLGDGGTAQVSVDFRTDGAIVFRSGGDSGTVIATWSGAFVANSFDHYQVKIIIDPTVGEVHVRKNGAGSDSFSATGLNTRGGTANSYANSVDINHNNAAGVGHTVDDFYCFDSSGGAPNDWVGDIRAFQMQPTLDTAQKQFSQNATGTSLVLGNTANSSTLAITAGTIQTNNAVSVSQGGTFTSVTAEFSAGFTGNAQIGLYLADGDTQGFVSNSKPGHLVAASNVLNNPATGVNTFTFPGTVGIMKGYSYFFGMLTDTNCTMKANSATAACFSYVVPGGFGSGPPSNLATLTSQATVHVPTFYVTLTATNAGLTSDEFEDGTTTYASDTVVGHFDLYDLQNLFYTPSSIIGVTIRSVVSKTDAGARGYEAAGKSGGTSFTTTEINPLTSFAYWSQFYNQDPDTSAPWTASGLNALQLGPKISS